MRESIVPTDPAVTVRLSSPSRFNRRDASRNSGSSAVMPSSSATVKSAYSGGCRIVMESSIARMNATPIPLSAPREVPFGCIDMDVRFEEVQQFMEYNKKPAEI